MPNNNSPSKTITKKNNDSASKDDLSPKKGGVGSDSESDDCNAEDSERDEGEGGNSQANQNFEWVALNSFKDLYRASPIFNQMCDFGPNIVPLSIVGMYLNYAGNHLLHYI